MFNRFRSGEDREDKMATATVERNDDNSDGDNKVVEDPLKEPTKQADAATGEETTQTPTTTAPNSQIGIGDLMDKRARLEEAIDYVGLMIKNLKDKRTLLEKDIEDESVDIKNLREKLQKVNEYIEDESVGITKLAVKRREVEEEADEVGTIINNLRNKLVGIDQVIDEEGSRVRKIKESRESSVEDSSSFMTEN